MEGMRADKQRTRKLEEQIISIFCGVTIEGDARKRLQIVEYGV